MSDDRSQRIVELFHAVLECGADEREAFLDQACAGDAALRRMVESLLAAHCQAGNFLDQTALAMLAAEIDEEQDSEWLGRQVGHYQILSALGRGGMGEVYRLFGNRCKMAQDIAVTKSQ